VDRVHVHIRARRILEDVEQVMQPTPLLDPTGLSIKGVKNKPDSGFRDLLKDMKKTHSQGFSKSKINTF
jgi:hypothetical protein